MHTIPDTMVIRRRSIGSDALALAELVPLDRAVSGRKFFEYNALNSEEAVEARNRIVTHAETMLADAYAREDAIVRKVEIKQRCLQAFGLPPGSEERRMATLSGPELLHTVRRVGNRGLPLDRARYKEVSSKTDDTTGTGAWYS